jgi:hypothetical protein
LRIHSKYILGLLAGALLAVPAFGQSITVASAAPAATADDAPATAPATPPQDTTPAATPPAAPTWSVGPIDFSGTVDGYYNFNTNRPADRTNRFYNFDASANQFALNFAKLGMAHSPDPVGFEFDLGFGQTMTTMAASNGDSLFDKFVEQAYVSLKPAKAKGFELDFGKFVTSAGAEVIETYSNWNYSRSLLFALAIPYFHFGVRTSWPMGKHWTGGFQVVNGWNDTLDNNSGKTLGANVMGTYSKWSWMFDWYGGPENVGTDMGWRELYDSTLTLTPSSKFSMYLNGDYGTNRNATTFTHPEMTTNASVWEGIAAAFHWQATSKWAFTPRIEWYDDQNGFTTGTPQNIREFTLTGEYKWIEGLMTRLEYRHDWSNANVFESGCPAPGFVEAPFTCTNAGGANSKSQDTITIGMIAFFGPKR